MILIQFLSTRDGREVGELQTAIQELVCDGGAMGKGAKDSDGGVSPIGDGSYEAGD